MKELALAMAAIAMLITGCTDISVTQNARNELKLAISSDISFATGRSAIKSNFAPVRDQFITGLRRNPDADVRIVGHTDGTGADVINGPLSVQRGASARDYLISRGTDPRWPRRPVDSRC